jgi:hypothetical protein
MRKHIGSRQHRVREWVTSVQQRGVRCEAKGLIAFSQHMAGEVVASAEPMTPGGKGHRHWIGGGKLDGSFQQFQCRCMPQGVLGRYYR